MLESRYEAMNAHFEKSHLSVPGKHIATLRRFTDIDRGYPHDHPWDFTTFLLDPYVEEVYSLDGTVTRVERKRGESHFVRAETSHKIVELPEGECWTVVLAHPERRETRFGGLTHV